MENEKWKPVFGYRGLYEVSDLGRVRSRYSGEWKVMKPAKNHNGYLFVNLKIDGRQKNFYLHRLVASAFIPNDNIFNTEINHINECKSDNRASNLEWCDRSYNLAYNGLRYRRPHPKYRRNAIKDLYEPNLSYRQNIELLKEKGIYCSKSTLRKLRKDLGLTKSYNKNVRSKIYELYNQNLTIDENIKLFNEQGIEVSKENGVECSRSVIFNIRKQLGLVKSTKKK